MKLSAIIICFSITQVFATTSYSQKTKVSLEMENTSIKEVLLAIENTSEFFFLYNNELIDVERKVDVNVNKKSIYTTLRQVFEGQDVKFSVLDRQIIISPKDLNTETIQQLEKTVTGKVTDVSGAPLPGVSVIIKGSTKGVITDLDGNYSIAGVSDESILEFSFVGMKTQEILVGSQTEINVSLEEDITNIEDVVVVGYGVQKKAHITGSIASVNSKELTKVSGSNTSAMLAGKLPGLIVTARSGQPGADEAGLSIRGFGDALVIVDGVEGDFLQLDPNEIASISILKDASAAVYGARAGNGVILVTTKQGRNNVAPKVNITTSMSYQQPTFMPEMASPAEYAQFYYDAQTIAGDTELKYTEEDIAKYKAGTEQGYRGTDWQDLVFREWAPMQQNNVNITGGSENVNYFLSVGNLRQESILNSGAGTYKRYNISSNVNVNVTKNLSANLNLKYREENRDNPVDRPDAPNEYNRIFRYIYHADPTVEQIPGEPDLMTSAYQFNNPYAFSRQDISGFTEDKRKQINVLIGLDYKLPIDGLSIDGKFALKSYDRLNKAVQTPFDLYEYDYVNEEAVVINHNADDRVDIMNKKTQNITTNASIKYDKNFGSHNVSALLLAEYQYIDRYTLGAGRTNIIDNSMPYLYGANENVSNYDDPYEDGRKAIVGRLNYNYKEKYLVEGLFRADACIRFPEDTRWGFFPGLSLGWRASNEPFLENINAITDLKIRGSLAQMGYDDISKFDYIEGYEIKSGVKDYYLFGSESYLGTLQTLGLPNPDITWETMNTYNAGVDAVLWNGKFGLEFDVFYRLRTGLLERDESEIPNVTFGADLPEVNVEERDNRGFELLLRHKNIMGDFRYEISGNITWTREKYVYYPDEDFSNASDGYIFRTQRTGEWVNRTIGYRTDGFYDDEEEIANETLVYDGLGAPGVGDIKYVDLDGNDTINVDDQEVIGRGNSPELFFGLNFAATYKGFDFSMMFQGAANYDIMFSGMEVSPTLSIGHVPYAYQVENSWAPGNKDADLPAPNLDGINTHNNTKNDMFLKSAAYLRLKSVNLGYTVPSAITEKVRIKSLRVFVSGYNLFTFKKLDVFDMDPEMYSGSTLSTYPVQRIITGGLTIGF